MNPLNANSILNDTEFLNDIGHNLSKSLKMNSVSIANSSSSSSSDNRNNNGHHNSSMFDKSSNNNPNNNISSSNSPLTTNNTFINPLNNTLFNDPFDVEHMPLTNPPIYEPDVVTGITRRRVSISNGQIGQLIDLHGLYESDEQATDYSLLEYNKSSTDTNTTPKMNEDLLSQSNQQQPQLQNDNNYLPLNIQPHIMQSNHILNGIMSTPQQQPVLNQQIAVYPMNQRPPPPQATISPQFSHTSQQQHTDPTRDSLMGFIPNFTPQSSHTSSAHPTFQQLSSAVPSTQQQQLAMQQQQQLQLLQPQQQIISTGTNPMLFKPVSIPPPVSSMSITKQLIPGTEAWKKARLLERNRRAATKCRQKKKIAQQQMQKESEAIAKENERLKKKVESLEATVCKLKDVLKDHASKCSNLADSIELLDGFLRSE